MGGVGGSVLLGGRVEGGRWEDGVGGRGVGGVVGRGVGGVGSG